MICIGPFYTLWCILLCDSMQFWSTKSAILVQFIIGFEIQGLKDFYRCWSVPLFIFCCLTLNFVISSQILGLGLILNMFVKTRNSLYQGTLMIISKFLFHTFYPGCNMLIIQIVDKSRSLSIKFHTNQSTNIGN